MSSKRLVRLWLACCAGLLAAPLWGYKLRTREDSVHVVKWYESPVAFTLKLSATTNLSDGQSQRSSVVAAMQAWNAQLGTVQLTPVLSGPGGYENGNDINEVVMASTLDGDAFPNGVLAITLTYTNGDAAAESDIVFNSTLHWDSYRGPLRSTEDIQRVAIHELGHALGLDHPDQFGQGVTAIMNSHVSSVDGLQADDIAGGQKLYGAPGFKPANDDFTNATAIALTEGTIQLTGSNIAATRDPGQPDLATSTASHTVWWKWTAPENGAVTLTTLGSDFDTVLSVYTGDSVSTLALVTENDDEEPHNPDVENPRRKRTSKVTFNAVSGTTYRIAIAGWGDLDPDGVPDGYTGSIALKMDFIVVVPPVFTEHPVDNGGAAGRQFDFNASVSGRPIPTITWQRRRTGVTDWTNVVDNGIDRIFVSTNSDYTVRTSVWIGTNFAMNGEEFRCMASSQGQVVYSQPAVLRVLPIPLPAIAVQPKSARFLSGISARLSVEASEAASYQWYRNGVPLTGQTKPLLFFSNPQAADAGDYHVVLTNPGGSTMSAVATVTVGPPATITNLSPTRQVLAAGETLSLAVSASGTGPLRYQWYRDGRPISGANAASYQREIRSNADTGAYWVAVTDDMGTRHGAPFFVLLSRRLTNVVAWGSHSDRSLEVPSALTDAIAVAAGGGHAIALRLDGTVQTWGTGSSVPSEFTNIVAVAASFRDTLGLRADGIVKGTGGLAGVPAQLKEVWAVTAGESYALALKTDGTVETWGTEAPPVNGLQDIVSLSPSFALRADGTLFIVRSYEVFPMAEKHPQLVSLAGSGSGRNTVGLNADGTVLWNSPAARDIVSAASSDSLAYGLKRNGTVIALEGRPDYREWAVPSGLTEVFALGVGNSAAFAIRDVSTPLPLLVASRPVSRTIFQGQDAVLFGNAFSGDVVPPSFQWQRNGVDVAGATSRQLSFTNAGTADAGFYSLKIVHGSTSASLPVIVGVSLFQKILGTATEVGSDIRHPNGNIFDQMLLTGSAVSFGSDHYSQQITRLSFIDLNDDIVQVELSGPGTLSISLADGAAAAPPKNYHQSITYMKGHAGIVVSGTSSDTHLSVFSVGRANAVDQTLFRDGTSYDGVADIAFIAIMGSNGSFGSLRTANVSFWGTRGYTGIYAPDVRFHGPVYVGDIAAFDAAQPVLAIGVADEVQINGGNLLQNNGRAIETSGNFQLRFVDGADSHGRPLPAQTNQGRLEQNGADITSQIIVNPAP